MNISSDGYVLPYNSPVPVTALPPQPRPENHPKTVVLEALDALALALAGHNHQWTPRERDLYEKAVDSHVASVVTTDQLVEKFLTRPLPATVCCDLCATKQGNPDRTGTNLLTASEAREMIEHLLESAVAPKKS